MLVCVVRLLEGVEALFVLLEVDVDWVELLVELLVEGLNLLILPVDEFVDFEDSVELFAEPDEDCSVVLMLLLAGNGLTGLLLPEGVSIYVAALP